MSLLVLRSPARTACASFRIRLLSSTAKREAPVELQSDHYTPAKPREDGAGPLVVLHGLYGSKQNWRSLAKGMATRLGREVHTLVSYTHSSLLQCPRVSQSRTFLKLLLNLRLTGYNCTARRICVITVQALTTQTPPILLSQAT